MIKAPSIGEIDFHSIALSVRCVRSAILSAAPQDGIHREKRDAPIMMGGDRVVRENWVRFFRLGCVFKDMHVNPGLAQRLNGRIEFLSRHQRQRI